MRLFRPVPHTRLFRALRNVALVVLLLAAAFFLVAAAEARRLRVDRRELESPDVPAAFDGARVVFVADVHAGPQFDNGRMAKLVKLVNGLKPDVLILGGDYVGGRLNGARIFYPEAAKFKATLGRYAVLGNHDGWEGKVQARDGFEMAGITLLENDTVRVSRNGSSVAIGGVEDLYTGHPDACAISKDVLPEEFSILVSHNPSIFGAQLPESRGVWDLALSGHTHGGQVNFMGAVASIGLAPISKHFKSGWEYIDGVPILVSNGVGTVTAPLRLFAQPEIHVITLKRGGPRAILPTPPGMKVAQRSSHS